MLFPPRCNTDLIDMLNLRVFHTGWLLYSVESGLNKVKILSVITALGLACLGLITAILWRESSSLNHLQADFEFTARQRNIIDIPRPRISHGSNHARDTKMFQSYHHAFPSAFLQHSDPSSASARQSWEWSKLWKQRSTGEECPSYLVFFIQVSDTNANYLSRLIQSIYDPKNIYLIHFDLKMEERNWVNRILDLYISVKPWDLNGDLPDLGSQPIVNETELIAIFELMPMFNIYFTQRQSLSWGGISLVLNVFSGFEYMVNLENLAASSDPLGSLNRTSFPEPSCSWSHFIVLSPSSFPLLLPADMRNVLATFPNDSFLHTKSFQLYMNTGDHSLKRKLSLIAFDHAIFKPGGKGGARKSKLRFDVERVSPKEFYKGEFWSVFSRSSVKIMLTSVAAKTWLIRLSTFYIPEEVVFQIVAMAIPELRNRTRNRCLHYVSWAQVNEKGDYVHSGAHPWELSNPRYELPQLEKSGMLFARKFGRKSTMVEEAIRTNLHGNESYVSHVIRILNATCFLSEPGCTETRDTI